MRSTRQAEPQKKNRLGLPECLSSCFFKAKPCTALLLRTPLTALWRVSVSRAPQQDRRASELACCRHRTCGQDEWETHRRERWPSGWRRRWPVSRDLGSGRSHQTTWEVVSSNPGKWTFSSASGRTSRFEGRGGWTLRQGGGCVSPLCGKFLCVTDHLRRRLCVVPRGCPV